MTLDMNKDLRQINLDQAKVVLEKKLDPSEIKQRDAGFGKKLDYISGATVIRRLNEAFNYQWDFYIIEEEVIESLPKYNKRTKQYEDQPPYIKVKGRLVVPGVCVKEQYGTKILLGGASEQEGAAKAAATDALKKCATLLGIGLELYEDGDAEEEQTNTYKSNYSNTQANYNQANVKVYTNYNENTNPWAGKEKEIRRLKELKAIMGIPQNDNSRLNVFVQEFTGNPNADYNYITPNNIADFNRFLENKLSEEGV